MKKFLSCLFLFLLMLTGCSSSKLSSITLDELKEKLKNKETFIIYFYQNNSDLEKTLNKVLKENDLKGYKIDTKEITDEKKNELELQITYEDPTIAFIINGKDPSKLSHVTSANATVNEITERLKDMNFIKK